MKIYHLTIIVTLLSIVGILNKANAESSILWQADAGESKISLVELYTSHGCHSCPPAENLMNGLESDSMLWESYIPLAFHVDYWNYIGWKDRFSKPKYSKRQRRHRAYGNIRSVYTPGWVINGKEWHGFFAKPRQGIPVLAQKSIPLRATLKNKNYLTVEIPCETNNPYRSPNLLYTAVLGSDYNERITAGENNGKTLLANFVVLKLSHHRIKASEKSWKIPLPQVKKGIASNKMALAVWLSDQNYHPVQAVGNWIEPSLVSR